MNYINVKDYIATGKKIISLIGAYVIAFVLFVANGGAWMTDVGILMPRDRLIWNMLSIVILLSLILFILNCPAKLEIGQATKYKLGVVFLCLLSYFYNFQGDIWEYIRSFVIMLIWFIVFLVLSYNKEMVWGAFVNVAIVFAIISLFFFVFGSCLNVIHETRTTALNWGVWDTSSIRSFYNVYYEAQFLKTDGSLLIPRNCGVFSEAPMYNFGLCVALSAEVFVVKKMHLWKCIILTITILTTFSTTGYIFLIALIALYFANIVFQQKGITIHKIAFIALLLLGVLGAIGLMIQKMNSISGASSINVRSDHLISCIKAWLSSPIIGVGFQNEDAVLQFSEYYQGMSMGAFYLLATGGIVLASCIIIPYIINAVWSIKNRFYDEFIFESLFLLAFFFTAVTFYPIIKFFIAYIAIFDCKDENKNRLDWVSVKISRGINAVQYSILDFKQFVMEKIKIKLAVIATLSISAVCIFYYIKHLYLLQLICLGILIFISITLVMLLFSYISFLIIKRRNY
mgnify:CR=1 FL=1